MAVNYAANGVKVQYGAAWWMPDHIRGINDQLDQLMETGLLFRLSGYAHRFPGLYLLCPP